MSTPDAQVRQAGGTPAQHQPRAPTGAVACAQESVGYAPVVPGIVRQKALGIEKEQRNSFFFFFLLLGVFNKLFFSNLD